MGRVIGGPQQLPGASHVRQRARHGCAREEQCDAPSQRKRERDLSQMVCVRVRAVSVCVCKHTRCEKAGGTSVWVWEGGVVR